MSLRGKQYTFCVRDRDEDWSSGTFKKKTASFNLEQTLLSRDYFWFLSRSASVLHPSLVSSVHTYFLDIYSDFVYVCFFSHLLN